MQDSTAKSPRDWIEDDIQLLIDNGVKESITLDYKGCEALQKTDGKKREISKDVSAFANSAGGTIVYGINESGHLPTAIDVGFDPADITREWLEQIINSTIQPRIDGIRINQIELAKTRPGRVMYVVEIPQTQVGGPHQASDNRYYRRFNFQSVPMEDYEVKDVMRRAQAPDLYLTFNLLQPLSEFCVTFAAGQPFSEPIALQVGIGNRAPEPAFHAIVEIYIDSRLKVLSHPDLELVEGAILQVDERRLRINAVRRSWSSPAQMPIFEGPQFRLTSDSLTLGIPVEDADREGAYFLGWRLMAPGMRGKLKFIRLLLSQRQLKIVDDLATNP